MANCESFWANQTKDDSPSIDQLAKTLDRSARSLGAFETNELF
jgi:hypothetical protein